LVWFVGHWATVDNRGRVALSWVVLQIIPGLLYLPWVPTAWRQITTWPSVTHLISTQEILIHLSDTLLFGLSWPLASGSIALVGLALILLMTLWVGLGNVIFRASLTTLWLWFIPPALLTFFIFSPAFLKFLLVATPPLALLIAIIAVHLAEMIRLGAPNLQRRSIGRVGYLVGGLILLIVTGSSALSLNQYYNNPVYARDNYRGIAAFIEAVAGPDDIVILNAEGQQDIFTYYYEDQSTTPVYPLPRQRPIDETNTVQALTEITQNADNIYAVYWAAQQADPTGLIENWLNSNLFKATDQWFGNVRLVSYARPQTTIQATLQPVDHQLGSGIRLTGYNLSTAQINDGDILQLALAWETEAALADSYTVFVQLLDSANHVVGQRDAAPLTATIDWPVGDPVTDAHGVFIEPGTPPGQHRLIVGLYNSQTGQRLPLQSPEGDIIGDFIELDTVEVVRRDTPLPVEAFNIQTPLNVQMLDVDLLGYDLHKVGHRSSPDTPLHPGDLVQLTLYWQPYQQVFWTSDQLFIQLITNVSRDDLLFVTHQPAGVDYPINTWQPGAIVRAQHTLFLPDVEPGLYRLALTLTVAQISADRVVVLTEPFQVK
ncbi:MAG: hypothetical protein AAF485_15470, partial [Chloroflexota bacterium]